MNMKRTCKCCGKSIEAEQPLVFEKCKWCSENCTVIHYDNLERISKARG